MRTILIILILIHGLIHLMGFSKAFGFAELKQLTIPISRPAGVIWLITTLIFIAAVILILSTSGYWIPLAMVACILSQVMIILSWKDAKMGTIANIIILVAAVLSMTTRRFEMNFKKEAGEGLKQSGKVSAGLVTDADIRHLPVIVQRYLHYTGVMNKPKVVNFRVVFDGQMRDKGKDFFSFSSEQYNYMDDPARLFFMKGKMYGITVPGYHRYRNAAASMNIRLFGLFPVVHETGPLMDTTETVTLFNDMCLLAPATLIDSRISWESIDSFTARAVFVNQGIRISATLLFNEKSQLVNFLSHDRTAIADRRKYPFSTPVTSYREINGFNLMSEGDAVWEYPDGKFVYGKFRLKDIQYNVKEPE